MRLICHIYSVTTHLRKSRLHTIEEFLRSRKVQRQGEILDHLDELGFEATQSSISRDLAVLGVSKQNGHYVLPDNHFEFPGIVRVATAGPNLIVVTTPIGAAQMVAYRLDEGDFPGIVGTVAGDDTIFIAVTDAEAQAAIVQGLGGLK